MKELTIKCVDAFTNRSFSGNPAGIIAGADDLSAEIMQDIASKMYLNIIECGFVMQATSKDAACRIRFFTPRREMGCSGHVMIAACYSMIEDWSIPLSGGVTNVIIERGMGNVQVDIHASAGADGKTGIKGLERIMIHQPGQRYRESDIPVDEVAEAFVDGKRRVERHGDGLTVVGDHDRRSGFNPLPLELGQPGPLRFEHLAAHVADLFERQDGGGQRGEGGGVDHVFGVAREGRLGRRNRRQGNFGTRHLETTGSQGEKCRSLPDASRAGVRAAGITRRGDGQDVRVDL